MKTVYHCFIAFFCCLSLSVNAQINPPTLVCIATQFNGDVVLNWDLPTNTCGNTFNGYRIYTSANPSNPFALLTIITDPTETTFTHTGANGTNTTWYYYMTTDLICPNEVPGQSVTLNNHPPAVTEIDFVTVNDAGNVELNWFENNSPKTGAYLIFHETPSGFVVIDTVWGRENTFYEHIGSDPSNRQETYTIVAMDKCGNSGLVNNEPHQTILLNASIDRCTREILLDWTPYRNWTTGVKNHQIWRSTNGGTPEFISYIGDTTKHIYYDANDGEQLCFYVSAVKGGTSTKSSSNRVCINVDVVQPMSYIYLRNVTVNANNQVQLDWKWDDNADISNYSIARADSSFNYQTVYTGAPNGALQENYTELDTTVDPSLQAFNYQLESLDSCGNEVLSNYGFTIHLTGEAGISFNNFLYWTPFDIIHGRVYDYTVHRIINGQDENLGTFDFLTESLEDKFNNYNVDETNICYYVVARAVMDFPDGTSETIYSRSNTYCIQQPVKIRVPNAFAPSGVNTVFKPVLVFGETSDFEMKIFNRWGAMIFETNDPDKGWDGWANGMAVRQGLYIYHIKVVQSDGKIVEQNGPVMLIR